MHIFNSTSIVFCICFPRFHCTLIKILLLSLLSLLLLCVTVAMIDVYNANHDYAVVDNDMKMQLMMMMVLKDSDETKQLHLQSAKMVAKYFQNLGDSLLPPNELNKVQAVLAEEFI